MRTNLPVLDSEYPFPRGETLVSTTDLKGRILHCNPTFITVSGFTREELLGQPHNLIRHPAMPRGVFKLLWSTLARGDEIFAYVVNLTRNGDAYWVLAHVTPTFDADGKITSYHSTRRSALASAVEQIRPIYRAMVDIEAKHERRAEGMEASIAFLEAQLASLGVTYEQFVFSL